MQSQPGKLQPPNDTNGNYELVKPYIRVRSRYVGVVVFPVKGGVDIILIQEYLAPGVNHTNVPDIRRLTLLCRSIAYTHHINWIAFFHLVVEGP